MKCWRVMGNNMKRGTWCQRDQIETPEDAKASMEAFKKGHPDDNFFVQEYEEARVGINVLSKVST